MAKDGEWFVRQLDDNNITWLIINKRTGVMKFTESREAAISFAKTWNEQMGDILDFERK